MFLTLLFLQSLWATSYAPVTLAEKVDGSQVILIGKVKALSCVNGKGKALKPKQPCTGPGQPNKLSYRFSIDKVLVDRVGAFKNKKATEVSFTFLSKAHTKVPEDNYQSEIGQAYIAFLNVFRGQFLPFHEAFYFADLSERQKVEELLQTKTQEGKPD